MDDLELYSTIEYSPGWYYKRWPGFYNMECYKVLSHYSNHPEYYHGVEESKDSMVYAEDTEKESSQNKKCKRKHEESS